MLDFSAGFSCCLCDSAPPNQVKLLSFNEHFLRRSEFWVCSGGQSNVIVYTLNGYLYFPIKSLKMLLAKLTPSSDVEWICVETWENNSSDFLPETLMHISIKWCLSLNYIIIIKLRGEKAEGGCQMKFYMFVFGVLHCSTDALAETGNVWVFTLHLQIQYLCMKGRDSFLLNWPWIPSRGKKIISNRYNFRGKMSQRGRERI